VALESSPKTGSLLYTREKGFINETGIKKTASMKQAYLRDMWYLLTLCLLVHPLLQLIRHQKT